MERSDKMDYINIEEILDIEILNSEADDLREEDYDALRACRELGM